MHTQPLEADLYIFEVLVVCTTHNLGTHLDRHFGSNLEKVNWRMVRMWTETRSGLEYSRYEHPFEYNLQRQTDEEKERITFHNKRRGKFLVFLF